MRVSRALAFIAALALVATAATPAQAELSQKGNLFVRFDGGISPKALPRESRAPVGVHLEGTIRQIGGQHPRGSAT